MRGRKPEKFGLKPTDKAYLRKRLRDGETPWRICQCYRDGDLQAALYDAPRPGRPRVCFQKSAQED